MSHTTFWIRQNLRMSDRVSTPKAYDIRSDLSQTTYWIRQNLRMSDRVSPPKTYFAYTDLIYIYNIRYINIKIVIMLIIRRCCDNPASTFLRIPLRIRIPYDEIDSYDHIFRTILCDHSIICHA